MKLDFVRLRKQAEDCNRLSVEEKPAEAVELSNEELMGVVGGWGGGGRGHGHGGYGDHHHHHHHHHDHDDYYDDDWD